MEEINEKVRQTEHRHSDFDRRVWRGVLLFHRRSVLRLRDVWQCEHKNKQPLTHLSAVARPYSDRETVVTA